MRELTSHKETSELNASLRIKVLDEPGPGGACHRYQVAPVEVANESDPQKASRLMRAYCDMTFQNGPIADVGVNGISVEALLAVVEDRLKGFQTGPFSCRENALALTHLQEAMHWLHHRTREREQRGVEGTLAK